MDANKTSNKVCVVILNLSIGQRLLSCLESIGQQSFKDFSVIIVNGAGPIEELIRTADEWIPEINILEVDSNLNIANAINLGINKTQSDYVAIVNSDVILDKYWLSELVMTMDADPKLGACASKVLLSSLPMIINSAGICFRPKLNACVRVLGWGRPDIEEFNKPYAVHAAYVGTSLYRRTALEMAGLFYEDFCEDYALYYLSLDIGLRLQLSGYRCLYNPRAVAYRSEKAAEVGPDWLVLNNRQNSRLIVFRCIPPLYFISPLILQGSDLLRFLIVGSYRRFRDTIALRPSLWRENPERIRKLYIDLRLTVNKREEIQRKRSISALQFLRILKKSSHNLDEPVISYKKSQVITNGAGMASYRMALVSHSYTFDGTERCLLRQASNLRSVGYDPLAIVPGPGKLTIGLVKEGVRIKIMPYWWWVCIYRVSTKCLYTSLVSMVRDTLKMRTLFRDEKINLVHTASSVTPQAALAAKLAGAKHIWHVREYYPNESIRPILGYKLTIRLIDLLSDRIIVPSRVVAGLFKNSSKVKVIPEGIDSTFFSSEVNEDNTLRKDIGAKEGEYIALNIGAIYPGKDQMTALKAISELKKNGINIHLVLCGDADITYKNLLLQEIEKLKLNSYVHFLGYRHDIIDVLDASDILLVTSKRESFGLTVVEAMARKVPVISTRCGGPEELIEDGTTGLLVDISDYKTIANHMLKIMTDPTLKTMIIKNASDWAQIFNSEKNFEATLEVYKEAFD